jgi:hypothetical protein
MNGLYWVDSQAQPGTAYDYLLVANRDGRGQLNPTTMLALPRDAQRGCIAEQ